jgi:hypothetical protein
MQLLAALIISASGLAADPVAALALPCDAHEPNAAAATAFHLLAMSSARANRPPVADAGADLTIGEGEGVQLEGAGSFDPDGDAISFQWVQVAGAPVVLEPHAMVANPAFAAPRADGRALVFELRVSDGHGHRALDRVVLTVVRPGQPEREAAPGVRGEVSLARR